MTNNLQSNQISCCQECGISSSDCKFLFDLHLKPFFRRICTDCVLNLNLYSFCPVCFDVYDDPSIDRVKCFKCSTMSHRSCISVPPSTYLCPLCSDPNFLFFGSGRRVIDGKSAKVILAAARIASESMHRAAAEARVVAERKVNIAAIAKKKAGIALERLDFVEKLERDRIEIGKNEDYDSDELTAEELTLMLESDFDSEELKAQKLNQRIEESESDFKEFREHRF